ncbi:hypothetical protein [Neorhizobium sp. NCHU2750]|uniref:hypothetical protein n=1 Tax=Neorhizobium sp. NCHU2750 TaxID=1825976 RepID=UPI000E71FAB9|nr:capsular polysaccharide biosynthesis protein [Neorhizobium sp. NCHU2750]
MTIALIASSAYVSQGLEAEFGRLPPSFLPLGSQRLFIRQIEDMSALASHVYLSLPDDFEIPPIDVERIERLGATIIRSDPMFSIGESIANCINAIGEYQQPLLILYGDTLVTGIELEDNFYSAHLASDAQNWAPAPIGGQPAEKQEGGRFVVSGLFSLNNVPALLQAIALSRGNFISALERYAEKTPLSMVTDGNWYDFGHVQTYFASCGLITTERSFNSLRITPTAVDKTSADLAKLDGEASWFESLPDSMRIYVPAYLGRIRENGEFGYRTANTYLTTLANLAVYGRLNRHVWQRIFRACQTFLNDSRAIRPPIDLGVNFSNYYGAKTEKRLADFSKQSGFDITTGFSYGGQSMPSPLEMSRRADKIIDTHGTPEASLLHGDFGFSNIFYDFRSQSVKVIDPRGLLPNGSKSIYGDPRYDVAKLAHSVIGGYDLIISGYISGRLDGRNVDLNMTEFNNGNWPTLIAAFREAGILNAPFDERLVSAILVHLFLSMIPLHADRPDRQVCFLGNAARLFQQMESL